MLNFGASKPRAKGGPPLDPHLRNTAIPQTSRKLRNICTYNTQSDQRTYKALHDVFMMFENLWKLTIGQ